MAQSNFIVQDVVHHIYEEREYRTGSTVLAGLKELLRKAWLYIFVMLFSLGAGYAAVYIADNAGSGGPRNSFDSGTMSAMKEKFGSMSAEQKKMVIEQLKARGGM